MNDLFLQELRRYLAAIHKRRYLVGICVALGWLAALINNYATRPLYQATAQILIDQDIPNVLPTKELVEAMQGSADYYQTQFELLRGRTLAERVVEK
ncbi:MAG TPA: Wzz/FepE/Etk N-terminal domain-containing protein, partial [Vicinamibacteria bacterium]|nr:Wzz/FepE/Etk N-terminal domain-containing protein [Vicinamibacteria bacterium]